MLGDKTPIGVLALLYTICLNSVPVYETILIKLHGDRDTHRARSSGIRSGLRAQRLKVPSQKEHSKAETGEVNARRHPSKNGARTLSAGVMVRFLWKRAIKQHAAFIVSMPSDRNGSKASLPHGFDVICGPVVGIKRAVGGVHQFGGQGGWNIMVSAPK